MSDAARERELARLLAMSEQLGDELLAMVARLDSFTASLIDDAQQIRGDGGDSG